MNERGQPANLKRGGQPGRKKGVPNKRTIEIQEFAREVLENPSYRAALKQRLLAGTAPTIESLLYYYGWGKPIERVHVSGADGEPLHIHLTWDDHDRDPTQAPVYPSAALTSGSTNGAPESDPL